MYKYSLESENIISILLQFYNIIILKEFYLHRWLKVLDVMLDKEKGPILGKLRIIQLIEVDF